MDFVEVGTLFIKFVISESDLLDSRISSQKYCYESFKGFSIVEQTPSFIQHASDGGKDSLLRMAIEALRPCSRCATGMLKDLRQT